MQTQTIIRKSWPEGKGTHTIWGKAQTAEYIADGITMYSTAGHGGYKISEKRWESMPEKYRLEKDNSTGTKWHLWYEEDCDWVRVYLSFPAEMLAFECANPWGDLSGADRWKKNMEHAEQTFERWGNKCPIA